MRGRLKKYAGTYIGTLIKKVKATKEEILSGTEQDNSKGQVK